MKQAESPTIWNGQHYCATRERHSKPADFMFTTGQACPVIAVAQILSRENSVAAWAIYVQRVNDTSGDDDIPAREIGALRFLPSF